MSRIKKLLVAVLCMVLALSATLIVVAACEQDETGYKLTLTYESSQGTVTASAPAEGKLYDADEDVTITVTPKTDYQIASVKVGSNDVTSGLDADGKYTFKITADTTVTATFEAKSTETGYKLTLTYESSQGTVTASAPAEGTLYDADEDVTITVTPKTDYQIASVKVGSNDVTSSLNSDGEYTFKITADTTVTATFTQKPQQLDWTDYIGTFDSTAEEDEMNYYHVQIIIAAESITVKVDNITLVVPAEDISFTQDEEGVKTFTLKDGESEVSITAYSTDKLGIMAFGGTFGFVSAQEILREGTDTECEWSDYVGIFESDAEEDALYGSEHIILNIREDSIKLTIGDQQPYEISADNEDFEFVMDENEDGESYGMFIFVAGDYDVMIYTIDENTLMIEASDGADSDLYGNLYRLGTHTDECEWESLIGTWTGATQDFATTPITVEITESEITVTIGSGEPLTAEDITVTEQDGLLKLSFTLNDESWRLAEQEDGTLNLFNMPGSEKDYDVYLNKQEEHDGPIEWPDAWLGTFEGEDDAGKSYVIEITSTYVSVSIDDDEKIADVTAFDEYEGFTIELNGAIYYISQWGYDESINTILFGDESFDLQVRLSRKTLGLDSALIGTWTGVDSLENDIELVITEYSITLNGDIATFVYVNADKSVNFNVGSFSWKLWKTTDGVHIELDSFIERTADLTRECEWTYFIGKYEGTNEKDSAKYVVEITATGVSVSINGTAQTVEGLSYNAENKVFTLTIGGTVYNIEDSTQDTSATALQINLYNSTVDVYLDRVGGGNDGVTFPQDICGTYTGSDLMGSDKTVTVEVTSTGVTINGTEITDITDEGAGEYSFQYDGATYILSFNDDGSASLFVANTYNPYYELTKDGQGQGCAWQRFIGEYEGEDDNGVEYHVVITETGVSVTINGQNQVVKFVSGDDDDGFEIEFGGTKYYIEESRGTSTQCNQINLYDADSSGDVLDVYLDRKGNSVELTDLQEIAGTWTGIGDMMGYASFNYTFVINADGSGSVKYTSDYSQDITELLIQHFAIEKGKLCLYYKNYESDADWSKVTFTYDGTTLSTENGPMWDTISLTKQSSDVGGGETVEIPAKFYGTFEGSASGQAVTLTISADGITFNFGGTDFPVESYTYDAATNSITFVSNGMSLTLTAKTDGDTIDELELDGSNAWGTKDALTRKSDSGDSGDDESNPLVGTWTGTMSGEAQLKNSAITITFTADSVTIVYGSYEFTGTYTYDKSSGTVTVDVGESEGYYMPELSLKLQSDTLSLSFTLSDTYDEYSFDYTSTLTKQAA